MEDKENIKIFVGTVTEEEIKFRKETGLLLETSGGELKEPDTILYDSFISDTSLNITEEGSIAENELIKSPKRALHESNDSLKKRSPSHLEGAIEIEDKRGEEISTLKLYSPQIESFAKKALQESSESFQENNRTVFPLGRENHYDEGKSYDDQLQLDASLDSAHNLSQEDIFNIKKPVLVDSPLEVFGSLENEFKSDIVLCCNVQVEPSDSQKPETCLDDSNCTSTSATDLDDTIAEMEKLLALADMQESAEAFEDKKKEATEDKIAQAKVQADPQLQRYAAYEFATPQPKLPKRLELSTPTGSNRNMYFNHYSPSPVRGKPEKLISHKPSGSRTEPRAFPKVHSCSPNPIPFKPETKPFKSLYKGVVESPVANYIHGKPSPSPFKRVVAKGNEGTASSSSVKCTSKILKPGFSSKLITPHHRKGVENSDSATLSNEKKNSKFKPLHYSGPSKRTDQPTQDVIAHAVRHLGWRDESGNASMIQNLHVEKKFMSASKHSNARK